MPGLLSHDFFPLTLGTSDRIPDPAKTEAAGAVLVRRRDSEEEAAAGNPTLGDLETW